MEEEFLQEYVGPFAPCFSCSNMGRWTTDPFAEEINGVFVWQYMCENCEYESGMDI